MAGVVWRPGQRERYQSRYVPRNSIQSEAILLTYFFVATGLWAGTIGTRRLLKLFEKYNLKTTWFIPGHSLETFPEECAMVRDAGHEIGLHGYSHENPSDMTIEQQRDVLDKTFRMLTDFCGKPPRGTVAPWWETSKEGADLLLRYGVEYDHSMSHHDCQMYWLRTGDTWTNIDYSKQAKEWMKPLEKGKETGLVEIPGNWYIDDLPPMMFIKGSPNSHGWVNPRDIEDIWKVCILLFFIYVKLWLTSVVVLGPLRLFLPRV